MVERFVHIEEAVGSNPTSSTRMKKILFIVTLIILVSVPIFTIFKAFDPSFVLEYPTRITNFIERGLGLIVFNLLFVQIILGAFVEKFAKKLGQWVFKFHTFNGIFVYLLVFLHAFSYVMINYFSGHGMDPYVAFINVCLICKEPANYYLTIGRISFWILTIGVFAAIFRKYNSWFSRNWRNLHIVNYIVFIFVAIHGFLLGTDFKIMPFFALAIIETICVLLILVFVKIPQLQKSINNWLRS